MKSIKHITNKMTKAVMKETTLSYRVHESTNLTEDEASAIVNALGFMQHAALTKAIDDLDNTAINKIIEDAEGFGSFSSPGQKPTGTKQSRQPSANTSNSYTAARKSDTAMQNPDDIDSLNIGDEIEIPGRDGEPVVAKIHNPNSVGDTIQVKTDRGLETVNKDDIKMQQQEEIARMKQLAGIEETSAGSVGGMAMPMGQVVKREPSTPKKTPRKKRN